MFSRLRYIYIGFVNTAHTESPDFDILRDFFGLPYLRRLAVGNWRYRFEAELPDTPDREQLQGWIPTRHGSDRLVILNPDYYRLWGMFKDLWLKIEWESLYRLFNVCHDMNNLGTLSLTIIGPQNQDLSFPTTAPWSIKALTVDITGPPRVHKENFRLLFEALKTAAPFVENLAIKARETRESAIFYIITLKRLRKLFFSSLSKRWPQSSGVVTLPLVEDIVIEILDPYVLWYLQCPLALSLSLACRDVALQNLNVGRWKSLQTLDLHTDSVQWTNISLPLVRSVTFSYRYSSGISQTFFCGELAKRPEAFPSLECLRMWCFPDWDIFFVMLEKRNFQKNDRISLIRTIAFPVLPSPDIVHAIACRLDGRLSERPSNYDLSRFAQLDEYFDLNL
jgi:hypothetical protein